MAIGVDGWNTGVYMPPQFGSYFLFLVYAAVYVIGRLAGIFSDATAFGLFFLKDPSLFYSLGRLFLGAAFGTATVWLLYQFGRRFFSERIGIFAALFLAVLPMHVQHSHYIYADIPLTFATTLFFYRVAAWMRKPSFGCALKTGLAFGFAVSVKYTALYFGPAILLAAFFIREDRVSLGRLTTQIFYVGLASVAAYALVSPYTFLDWTNFLSQVAGQSKARSYVGPLHHFLYSLVGGSGRFWMALTLPGILFLFKNWRRQAAVLALACAVYYGVNAGFSQEYARYMMPLLPILALFAAAGIEWINLKGARRGIATAVALLALIELAAPSLYSDHLFTTRDTRTEAAAWFRREVPANSTVVVDNRFFAPHLYPSRDLIEEKYEWLKGEESPAKKKRLDLELLALKGRTTYRTYALSDVFLRKEEAFLFLRPTVTSRWDEWEAIGAKYFVRTYSEHNPAAQVFLKENSGKLRLLASFSPYRDPTRKVSPDPFSSTAAPHLPSDVFGRKRLGPFIEIYQVIQ